MLGSSYPTADDIAHHEAFSLSVPGQLVQRRDATKRTWVYLGGACLALSLALSIAALSLSTRSAPAAATAGEARWKPISRIAFGSCTSYDLREQTIWTKGVIPAQPDAWIWVGDMAYMDNAAVSCDLAPASPQCNCTYDWIKLNKYMCTAGDLDHAQSRLMHQVRIPEYRQFLDYMCPGSQAQGLLPPPGSDPSVCPRPVLGTYDDHDYGYNNANRRLPNKHAFKQAYLDAIGEARDSPRRTSMTGLQTNYTFNAGQAGREIQVVLLDERYHRDNLPCQMRRAWCTRRLNASSPGSSDYVWCQDFLVQDAQGSLGMGSLGSCCFKDEQRDAWCAQPDSRSSPLYTVACDPSSSEFATKLLVLDQPPAAGASSRWVLREASPAEWASLATTSRTWPWLMQESPICEVLGLHQRQWLSSLMAQPGPSGQPPALRLIASGSVPFGSLGYVSPGAEPADRVTCSSDDWLCWVPAQVNFLHTLANASGPGCVVILTGDFHFGDIKMVQPGSNTAYSSSLQSSQLRRPVYQVMSSGMSESTAHGDSGSCTGTYLEDLVGLRPWGSAGRCAYTGRPNFGVVDVDWAGRVVHLQVRDGSTGGVATSASGQALSLTLSLDSCQLVN